jgi:hypothetical protein
MPRIELSIKTTYLPEWRTAEGIRELVQNAKDAETEFNAPMKIYHTGSVLRISNEGVVLPHEALLLGHTTKVDRQDMIGHFGEGLKLGVLALVRAGHVVKILSGEETWKPLLVRSSNFQAEVLAFDIAKIKHCGGVTVEVDKIPLSEWVEMKKSFLFLMEGIDSIHVSEYGDILLDSGMRGKLYVKGIFVQNETKLKFGYNLFNAPTDRDRKVISQYELGWRLAIIWSRAVSSRPALAEELYDMLSSNATDTESMAHYNASSMSQEAQDKLVKIFTDAFGEDAVPVSNILESKDISHLGRIGIVLPRNLAAILQSIMGFDGGVDALARKLGAEVIKRHSWTDLTEVEQRNLEEAVEIIGWVGEKIPMNNLEIATFRSQKQFGLWSQGKIVLSKSVLENKAQTLTTLIHEYAHHLSEKGDGDKSHIAHIERIWAGIFAALTK